MTRLIAINTSLQSTPESNFSLCRLVQPPLKSLFTCPSSRLLLICSSHMPALEQTFSYPVAHHQACSSSCPHLLKEKLLATQNCLSQLQMQW